MSTVMKFRLNDGQHTDWVDPLDPSQGERTYVKGDIIPSLIDLSLELDRSHPVKKFSRIFEGLPQPRQPRPRAKEMTFEVLDKFSVEELATYANIEEIDLHGAETKEDMIGIILQNVNGAAAE